jgi:hypothetical protein
MTVQKASDPGVKFRLLICNFCDIVSFEQQRIRQKYAKKIKNEGEKTWL